MKALMKTFLSLHVNLYRLTKGKMGGKMGGNSILLLNTVGRKSGKKFTIPLVYLMEEDNYILIASNGGADKHPGWYFNLKSQPQTTVQVMEQTINVTAEMAPPEERNRLWKNITSTHEQFQAYQEKTERVIQVFVLRPA
ncbi:MAG: nitroreductase/quinone reductase family protein [Chloroflexota bacterium]